jgi:tetratricopeptide (TPR) repeat protein
MKNIHDIGVSLSDLALLEQANKNYTKSMSLYEEAWNYMKSSSSLLNKGILLNVMADNYYYLNDFTQAFSKLESALKIFEELKDFYNIGENRLRKVKYYTKLLDNAEKNNQNADIENYRKNIIEECKLVLESFSKLREKNHEADALEILGDKYKRFGEYKIAIEYYKKSLEIFDRLKMTEKTYSLKDKIASISK